MTTRVDALKIIDVVEGGGGRCCSGFRRRVGVSVVWARSHVSAPGSATAFLAEAIIDDPSTHTPSPFLALPSVVSGVDRLHDRRVRTDSTVDRFVTLGAPFRMFCPTLATVGCGRDP